MSNLMKFGSSAIATELIPVIVQAAGIVAFLFLAKEDYFQSFVVIVLSLIWLKVSHSRMAEDFGDFRLRRHLFSLLGN